MKIPERERVAYGLAPLLFAGCQISFPRLLDLEQQLPVDFQRAVSPRFPHVEVRGEDKDPKIYHFSTAESEVSFSLSSTGLFVGTGEYQRWEILREHAEIAVRSFVEIYSPTLLTRIAVRYQNVIQREEIGFNDVDWDALIAPHLAGALLSVPSADVNHFAAETVISLEQGNLKLRYGLAENEAGDRTGFLIDCEIFDEQQRPVSIEDVLDQLDRFNREAGRAFRWCITDRLHEALRPAPIAESR